MTNRPRAYRLDDPRLDTGGLPPARQDVTITEEADAFAAEDAALEAAPARVTPQARKASWGSLLAGAVTGLLGIGIGLWAERLVLDLFNAHPGLGIAAGVLAGLALLALLVIVGREIAGIWREKKVAALYDRAEKALAAGDDAAAKTIAADLVALYSGRAATAAGRAALQAEADTLIDADDRLAMAERLILSPLDLAARRAIASAARQVSLVTAVSPRAIIDVAFTLFAATRLIRRIAAIYGGRPGSLGFFRLFRAVMTNLLVTGGIAAGDSLLQQAMGHGLAAKLSAKAGEGVLNGLLAARIGIAAIDVCRPLPFIRAERPRVADVAAQLLARSSDE